MIQNIPVKNIKPNPFQHRTVIHENTIRELAEEIKVTGLWAGALRGRQNNGHIELCSGHRRLEAIKLLKWKTVDVDVVELDDQQMIAQSLIENLQREGLNDADKADGIKKLVNHINQLHTNSSSLNAVDQVATLLGFSAASIYNWLTIADFETPKKELIRKRKIDATRALSAHRLGGAEMVKIAAKQELERVTLREMATSVDQIESPSIKAKVKAKLKAGKLTSPQAVHKEIVKQSAKNNPKEKAMPPDLIEVIVHWTNAFETWTKSLNEVHPYMDYVDHVPGIAKKFRAAAQELIDALQKFV